MNTTPIEEFLPRLNRKPVSAHTKRAGKGGQGYIEVRLCIGIEPDKGAYIQTVDPQGHPVQPDYHLYHGEMFNLLRTLNGIREEQQMEIDWGTRSEMRIYLSSYPYLLYQLLRCPHLVDSEQHPINIHEGQAEVTLSFTTGSRKDSLQPQFTLSADTQENTAQGLTFQFLTDAFVLGDDHCIYPIRSVGENFEKADFFRSEFSADMLEKYLSVFYSYLDNVRLQYEDYPLEYSEQHLLTQPTLIFEKVDADKALYLRVLQGVPGLDFDFVRRFDLVYLASITPEHRIQLRRIEARSDDETVSALRQLILHHAPSKTAQREVYFEDGLFIIPEETAGPFLLHALPTLVRDYQLVGADQLAGYKVKPVKPRLSVKAGSGIDFLEGEAYVDLGDEQFSLGQFLQQYRKNKYVALNDGNRAIIDEGYVRRLERLFTQEKKRGGIRVSFFDLPEVEALLEERMEGPVFEHHRQVYEGFNQLAKQRLSLPMVKAELRPYQQEGVKWINYLYENRLGGCLADDMGLGKTLQSISMLTLIYPKAKLPTLIVMPRSLLFNWNAELQKFAPHLKSYTYYGQTRDIRKACSQQVILTTYAMVRNDIETFQKEKFQYVILDESQNIKNVSSQTTMAIHLLQAEHRLALSGTPVENNLTELYSLFRFLNPTMFGSLEEFNQRYTNPIQRDGDKEVMSALRRKIFPFMLRRLKRDVLTELPERIDQHLYVEMEPDHAALYEKRRAYFSNMVKQQIATDGIEKSQFVMFQALNELRRLASIPESVTDGLISSPKIAELCDSLIDAVSNGHKVVVFFNFIAGLDLVGERLAEAGIDYVTMTGATRDRQGVVERFQQNSTCRVILMTLKTGGVGLNLTAADMVYIFEPWWNKAAEEQGINRLHRMGQKNNIMSFSIIVRNTIEEKIEQLQQQKAELFEGLIGSDTTSTKNLTEEDIKFILG